MKALIILVAAFLLPSTAMGQSAMTWDEFVNLITNEEEETEDISWIENIEELEHIASSPININTATTEELEVLPFLSTKQIEDIREYVARYDGMKTLFELQYITSLSMKDRRMLQLFVHAGDMPGKYTEDLSLKTMLKKSKHELLTRMDIPLYHRKGYLVSDGYRGSRVYNKTRYTLSATKHIMASFNIERDQGEKGIDHMGGLLAIKDMGHLKTFVAGDYKVGFGEGLVANQRMNLGKTNPTSTTSQGIRPHTGTDETNFMRGIAATMEYGDFCISTFISHRKGDATINDDNKAEPENNSTIKTIIEGGYHRTNTEWQKKNNFNSYTGGANISWNKQGWRAGATGYFLQTDRALEPGNTAYRRIYPNGKRFGVMGVNYGYEAYRWLFRGETAYSTNQGGIATLNTVCWKIDSKYTLTASQRYYDYHYYSFYASALSDNSNVQNETAATIRIDATPMDGLQMYVYADVFYNPWPRFGLKSSSRGEECVVGGTYTFNRSNTLSSKYSFKRKEYTTGMQNHHRLRLQWTILPTENTRWQTTVVMHIVNGSYGEAIGETFRYGLDNTKPLRLSASVFYFHTSDYNSRVFIYEPNVTNTMTMPNFYGHGARASGTVQYQVWERRIMLELKYGVTRYFDRKTQSSGLQTIFSNVKNDITLQLRIRI